MHAELRPEIAKLQNTGVYEKIILKNDLKVSLGL